MKNKKELEKQISDARNKLYKIEIQERIKENLALVGTFYKVRNNYSCPEKKSDYWWLYIHVIGIDKETGWLLTRQIQKDKYGEVSFRCSENRVGLSILSGGKKITKSEWSKIVNKIAHEILEAS